LHLSTKTRKIVFDYKAVMESEHLKKNDSNLVDSFFEDDRTMQMRKGMPCFT